jgi:hypothetical protein
VADDRAALLTALTTEHFTLQGARACTISESSSRAALYLSSVTSSLVALGFIAQVSEVGQTFQLFALAVIPVLFFLGLVTFVRVLESSVEDIHYGRAINRIRHYYLEHAGEEARYFMLGGNDDPIGVINNMAIERHRFQPYFTYAAAIAIVNSVVAGSGVAVLLGAALDLPIGVAVGAGVAVVIAFSWASVQYQIRRYQRQAATVDALFPSSAPGPSTPQPGGN